MSTVFIEPTNVGDLLKYEAPNLYSRDTITVASGQVLALGAVVGRVISNRKIKAIDPTATDGTQSAIGVLLQPCNATGGDQKAVLLARHAIVDDEFLVFPGNVTALQKNTAFDQLKSIGILPRQGV